MIIRSENADDELFIAVNALKVIVRAVAGFDKMDLATASEKKVAAINTPALISNAVV